MLALVGHQLVFMFLMCKIGTFALSFPASKLVSWSVILRGLSRIISMFTFISGEMEGILGFMKKEDG